MRDFHEIIIEGKRFIDILKEHRPRSVVIGADLSNTNLRGVDLSNLAFVDAKLVNSDLRLSDLSDTKFDGSDLSGANLEEANLINAIFGYSNLTNVNFKGADLAGTVIDHSNLCGANLRNIILFLNQIFYITYDDNTVWPDGIDLGIYEARAGWKKQNSK
jgi:uncharacterized protein YjbI with pentapeptide repeats